MGEESGSNRPSVKAQPSFSRFLIDTRGAPGTAPDKRSTILFIEDNDGDVILVKEALGAHSVNCELLLVADGDKAFRAIEEMDRAELNCPELVILDLNLPKKSGREVLRKLRGSIACANASIVILSSSDTAKDRQETQELGATCYIRKPSNYDAFVALGGVFKKMLKGDAEL